MKILTTNRTNGTNRYVGCIPPTGWGGIGLMDVIFNIFNVCNRLFVNFCYPPPKKLMDIRSFSVTLQTLLKK